MTDTQLVQDPAPAPIATPPTLETTTAEATPTTTKPASRTRRWLAGAMLVTVGMVAGGGATYGFTSTHDAGTGVVAGQGGPVAGRGERPLGTPPDGSADGQAAPGSTGNDQPA